MSLGHERRLKGRPKRTRCGQADIGRTRHGRAELSSTRNRQRCDEGYGPIAAAGQRRFPAASCLSAFMAGTTPQYPTLDPANQPLWWRQRRLQHVGQFTRSVSRLQPRRSEEGILLPSGQRGYRLQVAPHRRPYLDQCRLAGRDAPAVKRPDMKPLTQRALQVKDPR